LGNLIGCGALSSSAKSDGAMPLLPISKLWLMCVVKCVTTRPGQRTYLYSKLLQIIRHQESDIVLSPDSIRKALRQIVAASETFGLVTPREKTCLLYPVVGRFMTGDTIRVVQPAKVLGQVPWELEGNRSSGIRLTYDVLHGKGIG
jgi:hypothetical protein